MTSACAPNAITSTRTVMLFANTSWYLWNFRRRLAVAIGNAGHRVLFVAPRDAYSDRLLEYGRFVPVDMSRSGKNPLRELGALLQIRRILRRERPDIVLTWTPKSNIYTGLVINSNKARLIPNIAGLGTMFVRKGPLSSFVGRLYASALERLETVFFQNSDDRDAFIAAGWVQESSACVLPGSGVDLERFSATPLPANEPPVFLFGGRLLREKGLPELVEASRQLRADGQEFRVRVYGHFDPGNPSAVDKTELANWVEEGLVEYCGSSDSMETALRGCDCVVHPSYYREGVPRILLEAAASGRLVVTTDSVGCRDAVEDGVTGLLCDPRDAASLAAAMRTIIEMPIAQRESMARSARRLAESRFDEQIIVREYLAEIG